MSTISRKRVSTVTHSIPFGINRVVDRIRGFLESFEGEKDVTRGLADMDLRDEQDDRFRRLKYMKQLVCHK